ncbi:MAG: hypothetical protein HY904_20135, partial [Deltaproteobacteria bacterium]|nr:hypothetical protein [Deltaproteobacteria bacterium]
MGTRQRYACWAAGGLLLGCAWIADASAAPRKPPAKAPPPPVAAPAPEPAPPPAPDPAPAPARAPVSTEGVPTAQLLAQAQQACEADEYDVCAERAAAVLARGDVTDEQRAQAFMLQGGAASVLGRGADAERAYRLLLRIKPDYDLPPDTPPKMAGNFRKVQAEEGEIRRAVKEAQRQKLVKAIKLVVDAPKDHKGGTPLPIRLNVEDPLGGIRGMTLEYRVGTAGEFATLPFQATPRGPEVEFSAAQMSTDAPLTLQYVVIARDADGDVLLAQGDRE